MTQEGRRQFLIRYLLNEDSRYENIEIPDNEEDKKVLLRSLLNIRLPKETSQEFIEIQNSYLQNELKNKGYITIDSLERFSNNIYLYKGDITLLQVESIVNAANSKMLGCFIPNHKCIDNAIHTFSGVQLRKFCDNIIKEQGHDEKTGFAKLTPAFNLPSDYIIHTVGPIVSGELTEEHRRALKSSYLSCLELATEEKIDSIAFCCISTGEFRFPNEEAAEIAVNTVKEFINNRNNKLKVIFNVFKDVDELIYRRKLSNERYID